MPSEAWENLPVELKQQMHWLAARMTAGRMNMGLIKPTDQLTELALATLKPSSVARKRILASPKWMRETAHHSATTVGTQEQVLGTVLRLSASTTSSDARLTQSLVVDDMPRATRLENVYRKWQDDEEFAHLKEHANFVPGDGPWPNPRAIIIGEAPGQEEDKHLRPFCGRSGNMLDGMMWDGGLKRADCFVTNVVKWRPPRNRTPTLDEVEFSIPYLRRELMVVMPEGGLVILLGQVPLSVVDQDLRVGAAHGKPFTRGNWTFLPMYHPAFILRQWKRRREEYRADWAKVKKLKAA